MTFMPQPLSNRTPPLAIPSSGACPASLQYNTVNLSRGFPDFDPPQPIMDRLAAAAHEGPHQHAVTWCTQNFREAPVNKQSHYMGRTIDPNTEMAATCGSTGAMMCAMMTVANSEDKVIVFFPFLRKLRD